ncbi:hypothetical protein [Isoptericola dokdonensis]|nr:hypothetical protein [Isoptericola dokdonensis]
MRASVLIRRPSAAARPSAGADQDGRDAGANPALPAAPTKDPDTP